MSINEQQLLSCIEINPSIAAKKSIIWLHGLGADGSDFVPIVSELDLPPELGIRFVFPHAPVMPITINQGYEMRAWYDIFGLSIASKTDKPGISNSILMVEKLIAKEEALGITSNNIILAGFSQGAVITLATGLSYPKPLAGLLALSGYLPLSEEILTQTSPVNRNTSIFMAHGTEDTIVPFALGQSAFTALKQAGYPVTWHSYPMSHSVCREEVDDIRQWIIEVTK